MHDHSGREGGSDGPSRLAPRRRSRTGSPPRPHAPARSASARTGIVALVVLLLCVATVLPVVDARTAGSATADAVPGGGTTLQQVDDGDGDGDGANSDDSDGTDGATNGTTTADPHLNPDEADGDGNLARLEAELAGRMLDRIGRSTVSVERGDYERARAVVGNEYDDLLRQYVVVANATEGGEERAERFLDIQREQREFTDSVAAYNETRTQYEAAKRAGNETEARELARELDRIARETSDHGDRLTRGLSSAAAGNTRDVTTVVEGVAGIQSEIDAQQAVIEQAEFTPTRLAVTTETEGGSFVDPIRLEGRIDVRNEADDGWDPVTTETVTVLVNGTEYVAPLGSNGTFAVEYRPTTARVGTGPVVVEYVPPVDSVYLGASDEVVVDVAGAAATLTLGTASQTTRYGAPVLAAGTVRVDGVGAPNVPVALSVGDTTVGVVRTDVDGRFSFAAPLPADVPDGVQRVAVSLPFEGRALTATPAVGETRVETTGTALTVAAEPAGVESAAVSGRLTTSLGAGVPDQLVRVWVGGRPVGAALTGPDGRFVATVGVPAVSGEDRASSVPVRVAFDGGAESNLAAAEETTRVTVEFVGRGAAGSDTGVLVAGFAGSIGALQTAEDYWLEGAVAGLAVVLVGAVLVRRRRTNATGQVVPSTEDTATETATADADAAPDAVDDGPSVPVGLLTVAREELDAGNLRTSVEASYVAGRVAVASTFALANRGTHREFLAALGSSHTESPDDVDAATVREFRRLTNGFEAAAFSSRPPTADEAVDALDVATALVSDREADDGDTGEQAS